MGRARARGTRLTLPSCLWPAHGLAVHLLPEAEIAGRGSFRNQGWPEIIRQMGGRDGAPARLRKRETIKRDRALLISRTRAWTARGRCFSTSHERICNGCSRDSRKSSRRSTRRCHLPDTSHAVEAQERMIETSSRRRCALDREGARRMGTKLTASRTYNTASNPPSTYRICPFTKLDAAEARKTTAPPSSDGSPHRPAGTRARSHASNSGSCWSTVFISVAK